MKNLFTLIFSSLSLVLGAQSGSLIGQLQDAEGQAVVFANVALYNAQDSSLAKVETSNETGLFKIQGIPNGNYYLDATYVGVSNLRKNDISIIVDEQVDLGVLYFPSAAVELQEATVTAQRAMVEVKPDRTVFNVQGTINSTGADGLSLLRKAPGVMVDNNNNIMVLGRSGVRVFVDGKPLPLNGDALVNYLQNLQAEQIDRLDIITNPGAKYEAEGNAGIIDIRLKKDKNHGTNGTFNVGASQGRLWKGNTGVTANHRNKKFNIFGGASYGQGNSFYKTGFKSTLNDFYQEVSTESQTYSSDYNLRGGVDYFISKKSTIGFLANFSSFVRESEIGDTISLAQEDKRNLIDSILVANSSSETQSENGTFNINYRYDNRKSGQSLNVDLDYGSYRSDTDRYLPNLYYDDGFQNELTKIVNVFDMPSDIDIYTFKVDYEQNMAGGKLGIGSKLSKVVSDNTFLFSDEIGGLEIRNDTFSNNFIYDENVYAGYVTYNRPLNKQWNMSLGLRAEQTDAQGDLTVYANHLDDESNPLNYLQWFPNAGLTYAYNRMNSFNLAYGRRINRPDYNVLNPFNSRISELSYEKGNPRLNPEIVNNIELGWTWKYRYNFKVAYSRTLDQITRLIGADVNLEIDPNADGDARASFITWDNLATQEIYSFNASLPIQISKVWNLYLNAGANHKSNQSDYGAGKLVDLSAFSYNFYQQHTFQLGKGLTGEVSGWFSGPGIWGGVFEHEESWSLNFGLQKKFLNKKLNVRINAEDVFYKSGWRGISEFDGLVSAGNGAWDSRRVGVNLSYNFGNQNVKSRNRKTGMEDEAGRLSN